jgi:RNA polymerase sigma-70 factor (ECF subfamily)
MQEVALAVVANRAPLADPKKLAPWLYQIAIRQTLLYRRKHGRRRKLVDRYADRYQPTEEQSRSPNPLDWLLAQERATFFRRAMDELSERDREILLLKYHHDWSYRKIAEQLSLSESAVEARLHRARQRLRQRLVKLDVVDGK